MVRVSEVQQIKWIAYWFKVGHGRQTESLFLARRNQGKRDQKTDGSKPSVHVDTHMKSLTAVFALSILLLVFLLCALLGWYKVKGIVGMFYG